MCPAELTGSPLDNLRHLLEVAMDVQPPQFDAEFLSLERETKKLRTWLGGQSVAKPPKDASREALKDFVQFRDLPTLKHATLASFGCADPFGDRSEGLIGDEELFPIFLKRVDDYRDSPRGLRLCFRGLLHAYFQYDVERRSSSVARHNWNSLRAFLKDRALLIVTPGFQPSWVGVLHKNPEALGLDPGGFYGSQIFQGRSKEFDEIRTELPITDDSWFLWRVIIGQIEAATQSPDHGFRLAIPSLLTMLEKHPVAKTFGLSKLLARYHQCKSPVLHEGLRDFAVGAWGNPWLALNEAAWSLVSPEARIMVAEWLKLALMQKFFGLLADDKMNDNRRLKFWETYHQSIHAMYFALGETARTHQGPDYREVRKQMDGLQLTLVSSTAQNNAFIMCIGEHVIVEFGEKGNACFIFHRDRLPFKLEGEVAGNYAALKHHSHVSRLLHTDRLMLPWEERFRQTLSEVVRIKLPSFAAVKPSTLDEHALDRQVAKSAVTGSVPQNASSTVGKTVQPPTPQRSYPEPSLPQIGRATFTMSEFNTFCTARRLSNNDLRPKGGNLWVYHKDANSDVAKQLSTWRFRFKPDAGWWFK